MIPFALLFLVHEGGVSSSRIEIADREVRVTLTFSLEDIATGARLDADGDGHLDRKEYEAVLPLLFAYVRDRYRIWNQGEPCTVELLRSRFTGDAPIPLGLARTPLGLELRCRSSAPIGTLRFRSRLFREHSDVHRHLIDFPDGRSMVLDRDRDEIEWRPSAKTPSLAVGLVIAALFGVLCMALRGWVRRGSRPRSNGVPASRHAFCTSRRQWGDRPFSNGSGPSPAPSGSRSSSR